MNNTPKIIQGKPRYFKLKISPEWNTELLGNLFNFVKGELPKEYFNEKASDRLPYLTSESFNKKSQYYVHQLDGVLVNESDIIMLGDGEGSGRVYTSRKGILTSTFILFKKQPSVKIETKFVFYYLAYSYPFLRKTRYGTGIPHVDKFILKNLLVPIPPTLEEQQKIALILSNIDELIQKQQQVIAQTKKLMKGQMQKLFLGKIALFKFKKLPLKKDHKRKPLKELCISTTGEFLPANKQQLGDIPVFGGNGITGCHNQSLIKKPVIIIGRVGQYCGSVYLSKKECWVTDNAIFLKKIDEEIDIEFLFRYLINLDINYLAEVAAQPKITQNIIGNLIIDYPVNKKEQQKISSILSNLDLLIQQEKQYKEKLENLKKGLMQQLLTGEKRVIV